MGRPPGTKGTKTSFILKKKILKKVSYACLCGANLASRGALSNHWRLIHKNNEYY